MRVNQKKRKFSQKGALAPLIFSKKVLLLTFFIFLISEVSLFSQNKINLNRATLEELKSLPGIGEVTAKNIIEYREKVGVFKNLEELKKVKGIGEKKFEVLKNYLTLDDPQGNTSDNKVLSEDLDLKKEKRTIYYYYDEKGVLHYTQFPEMVPPKYRKTLKPLK
jgi:competence protein ComEA